jgi:hypothetical protein
MQKLALGLVAVAGLATVAAARPDPKLSLQFSSNDSTWSDDIIATAGTSVFVRVIMSVPDSYYGISGARYNVTADGSWGTTDGVNLSAGKGSDTDGRLAGFDFGGQTQQVYSAAGSLRIDAKGDNANNVNAGISTSQNTPGALGTNFNTNKTAVVFKFRVDLAASHATTDVITFRILDGVNGTDNITSFKAYETASSTSGFQLTGELGDVGTISFAVPAPGALALMGMGGLAAARRRR